MRNSPKPCSAKAVSASGRQLHGTAALLRLFSQAEGFDSWQQKLVRDTAEAVASNIYLKVLTLLPSPVQNGQEHAGQTPDSHELGKPVSQHTANHASAPHVH